jgi:hypothetical protein
VTEPTNERPLKDLSLDESGAYIDEIDAMSLEELEARLPEAQDALEAIEAKLEELMGLRDAALGTLGNLRNCLEYRGYLE